MEASWELLDLPNEMLWEILLRLEPKALQETCKSSSQLSDICKDQDFWKRKLEYDLTDFPDLLALIEEKFAGLSWKTKWLSTVFRPRVKFSLYLKEGNIRYPITEEDLNNSFVTKITAFPEVAFSSAHERLNFVAERLISDVGINIFGPNPNDEVPVVLLDYDFKEISEDIAEYTFVIRPEIFNDDYQTEFGFSGVSQDQAYDLVLQQLRKNFKEYVLNKRIDVETVTENYKVYSYISKIENVE